MFQQKSNQQTLNIIEAQSPQFPQRRFLIQKQLGSGSEGTVMLAQPQNWIENQFSEVALKISNSQPQENEIKFVQYLKDYQSKFESQQNQQSGIIRIFDTFQWNQKYIQVMELGAINLFDYLKQEKLSEIEAFNIVKQVFVKFEQILIPIEFLHKQEMMHRDLKPENYIRIGEQFKLIDFGLIKQNKTNVLMTANVGTPIFSAPEIILGQSNYTKAVDIWSLGCVFFEVLTNIQLIEGIKFVYLNIITKHQQNPNFLYERINQHVKNLQLKQLIKDMIHPRPEFRLDITRVRTRINQINLFQPTQFQQFQQTKFQQQIIPQMNILNQDSQKNFGKQLIEIENSQQVKGFQIQVNQEKKEGLTLDLLENLFEKFSKTMLDSVKEELKNHTDTITQQQQKFTQQIIEHYNFQIITTQLLDLNQKFKTATQTQASEKLFEVNQQIITFQEIIKQQFGKNDREIQVSLLQSKEKQIFQIQELKQIQFQYQSLQLNNQFIQEKQVTQGKQQEIKVSKKPQEQIKQSNGSAQQKLIQTQKQAYGSPKKPLQNNQNPKKVN